jgi:hypothetical protein
MHPTVLRRTALLVGRAAALALVGATALTGCGDWTIADTALEVTAAEIGFRPGAPVVGRVLHPEGAITVTLAPAPIDPRRPLRRGYSKQESTARDVVRCEYVATTRRYSCPTEGLAQGRYVVQVTDAGMPSEGTVSTAVALHEAPGYNPAAGLVPYEVPGEEGGRRETFEREAAVFADAGEPARVPLTGWAPGTTARASVRADGGKELHATTVDIGADGTGVLRLPPFRAAEFNSIVLTDGVWVADLQFLVENE